MTDFTDIHCHVLPGVDDGSRSYEESLEMLRYMYDEGIGTVILTPHYHGGRMETAADVVRSRYEKLKALAAADEELSYMDLYVGAEIFYFPSIVDWLEEGRVLTMAGSDYVLLEFGYSMDKRSIADGINTVVSCGYRPIIAHIERYRNIVGDLDAVDEFIERGAFVQINSEAFHERHKIRSFVNKMLKRDMVHFVATDAHDTEYRPPQLYREAEYIAKHFGEDMCYRLLVDNPAKVINNEFM